MLRDGYVLYEPSVEVKEPDEEALTDEIVRAILRVNQDVFEIHRHAIRQAHAKSHGVLKGELTVYPNLPDHLRQGLFATPRNYPIIVRFSTAPGDILSDQVPAHFGMAIKALGVEGQKAEAGDNTANQDILLVNSPVYFANMAKYLQIQQLIEKTTGSPEVVLKVLESAARGTTKLLGLLGVAPPMLIEALSAPPNHILGETFHSMAALRFGDYIAKFSAAPLSDSVRKLTGTPLPSNGPDGLLRDLVVAFFKNETAEYELRAQLCTDLDRLPVEDASVEWRDDLSPPQPVAKITLPPQEAYSPQRRVYADDVLSFKPWRCLEAHKPLGSIMRLRMKAYEASSKYRHDMNAQPRREPSEISELPD